MFRTIGAPEIILILVIILIFFGVGKLPQVGNALGKGIRAFRRGQSGEAEEEEEDVEEEPVKTTKKTTAKKTTTKKKTAKKSDAA